VGFFAGRILNIFQTTQTSSMNTTQRSMTSALVKAIMQKRVLIPADAVGQRVKVLVQGNGNIIDVKDKDGKTVESITQPGTVLQKKIFNARANSGLAMQNERTRSYLIQGLAAEKAGGKLVGTIGDKADTEFTAHDYFNAYLNSVQISFGILLPSNIADQVSAGTEIAGSVVKINTDNGSLLTFDPSTISIVEAKQYGATTFNLEDFLVEAGEPAKTTA
jgi:hypothetical protein